MQQSLIELHLILTVVSTGFVVFLPWYTKRAYFWQKVSPRHRKLALSGFQILFILIATGSLLPVLSHFKIITFHTEESARHWIEVLRWLTLIYLCAISFLEYRERKTKS